eukprot:5642241-Pleurochrysis_carterae.AAC.1
MTKGVVKGYNHGDKRHELERGDAVGPTRVGREGEGEEESMAVAPEAQISPLPIRLRRIHGDKERGHMASRIAQRGRQGRGDGQQRRAAVVREP